MRLFRYPALMAVMLLLAGCAQVASDLGVFNRACKPSASARLANIDWDHARIIKIRIRQDTFTPTYVGLAQGMPYRLMIENADDGTQVFRAMEFFNSVAVSDVRVISGPGSGLKKEGICSGVISIAPGGITEVHLVSGRDGVYEFDDNPVPLSWVMAGGAGGFIVVQPKYVIPESPLKHLKMMKRKKFDTGPVTAPPAAAPSGGLFDGAPTPKKPAPAPAAAPSGGLFDGAPTPKKPAPAPAAAPSGGLFDGAPTPEKPAATPSAAPSGGLFDGAPAPQSAPAVPVEALPVQALPEKTPARDALPRAPIKKSPTKKKLKAKKPASPAKQPEQVPAADIYSD